MPQSSELSIDNGNNSSNNINNNNQLYAYGSMSTNIESGQNKIDDEEMNSLLDNSKLNEKNITWKSIFYEDIPVIANVSSAIMGVSIFAMPWGFLQSGVLGGTIITIFVAYLSFETARILLFSQKVLFQRTGEVRSYAEIASETLGSPSWGGVVKIATVISCLGSCVGYLIFLGEICGQLFDISLNFALFIAIFPLTILAWIRSFRELTVFTTIGVVAIIATVVYVVYDGQLNHDETDENDTFTPLFIPKTALNFVGPATFLFTSHYCVLAMGAEALEERQWQREHSRDRDLDMQVDDDENEFNRSSTVIENLNRPVAIAYALSAILIIIHGSTGYILFRNVNLVT